MNGNATVLNIAGYRVQVDVEEELRKYSWYNDKWTDEKLIASSPFRDDSSPSFFVDLTSGGWADSGAIYEDMASGNFVKLIALLNGLGYDEAAEYILDTYGILYDFERSDTLKFEVPKLRLNVKNERVDISDKYRYSYSSYLDRQRNISDEVSRLFSTGERGNSVYMPWTNAEGRIVTAKFRSIEGKTFYYDNQGEPVSDNLFGEWQAKNRELVVVCEAEIDALSWWTAGIPAVATGGAHLSRTQADKLRTLGAYQYVLAGDNDDQGEMFNNIVYKALRGYGKISMIRYPNKSYKDANDVLVAHGVAGLRRLYEDYKEDLKAVNVGYVI